jgi:cyclopropane fatty-acyl-phospholipid synthase-like methyltransferase
VGCSAGHFLHAVSSYVGECIGIEFNKEEAEFASKTLGFRIYTKPVEHTDISYEYFDVITVFQVLEHMAEPASFLKTIGRYLKHDGYLIVEVPNVQDALMSLYDIEEYRDFWFREPHIFYYSPNTLSAMLEKCGFSGRTSTTQNFNLANHFHWMLNRKPQLNNAEMSRPVLVNSDSTAPEIKKEFNQWFQKLDQEYKRLLNKHQIGENVFCIATKKTCNP